MSTHAWISVAVFFACYLLFVLLPARRSWVALGGGLALVAAGVLGWREALFEAVEWNVIGLFFGTLVLAELFLMSRMPAVLAEWLVDRMKTARGAMLAVCLLAGFLSAFLENVAVVLLLAPVALSLTEKLKLSPVRLLLGIAIMSNLEGTATLIGDPPSMILAGYLKLSFNDFFFYHGRPSIFFAIQLGLAGALAVLWWLLRDLKQPVALVPVEKVRSHFPAALMGLLVLGLAFASLIDRDFEWFAGTLALALAAAGLLWYRLVARWGRLRPLLTSLDWDTTLFLAGVFVVVGALTGSGVPGLLAGGIARLVGDSELLAFLILVATATLVSGFVDNVPFLTAMIPVTQKVADSIGAPVPLLMFGLLIGVCLGGNITPIGASANLVAMGLLKKQGHPVSFRGFMRLGIPITAVTLLLGGLFIWLVWRS
ncbi:MAG: SLC13 family permease [Lentisphaeria bacterium]|jgi:Na+/H+ antiporter NhaD/arsenite permease-like protein